MKRCFPMCGGKKFEFGYETLSIWKVEDRGAANLLSSIGGGSWLSWSVWRVLSTCS